MRTKEEIRREIDNVDDELCQAFLRRIRLVDEMGELKKTSGFTVEDKSREDAILGRLCDGKTDDEKRAVLELYDSIFSISKKRQRLL